MFIKFTKILIILLINAACASTDEIISKYKKEAEVIFDSNILFLNDPKVGNHDCEEQAVLLMDILSIGKKFSDHSVDIQNYLTYRYMLSPKYERDVFGKISGAKKVEFPQILEIRKMIIEYSYKRLMEIAKDLFSEEEIKDDAFVRGAVGDLGLQRMTTCGGIMILFAYAKKYGIPVVFILKRVKNDKEVDNTLIPFIYNGSKFVFDESVDYQKPAFFIRMFLDETRSGNPLEEVNMQRILGFEKTTLINLLKGLKSLGCNEYIDQFKKVDPFEFVLLLAAEDDQNNHKRNLTKSKILSKYKEILKIRQKDGAINKEAGPYAIADFIPSIRHVYVSTLVEQMF